MVRQPRRHSISIPKEPLNKSSVERVAGKIGMAHVTLRQRSSAVKRTIAAPLLPIASLCSPVLATCRRPALRRCARRAMQVVAGLRGQEAQRSKRQILPQPYGTGLCRRSAVSGSSRREWPFASSPFVHPIPQSRRRARVGLVQWFPKKYAAQFSAAEIHESAPCRLPLATGRDRFR